MKQHVQTFSVIRSPLMHRFIHIILGEWTHHGRTISAIWKCCYFLSLNDKCQLIYFCFHFHSCDDADWKLEEIDDKTFDDFMDECYPDFDEEEESKSKRRNKKN